MLACLQVLVTKTLTLQLKGNLTHAGNSHRFFMRVAHTHVCMYAQKVTATCACIGIHARQRITVTGNHTASSHYPQFFMLVYLLSTHLYVLY